MEPVQPAPPRVDPAPVSPSDRAAQLTYLIFGVVEALIAIRLILKLLAANPDAAFAAFIYNLSAPFVAPFQGIFATPQAQGSVLEIFSLLAILVYALVGYGLARLVQILGRRRTTVTP